MAGLLYHEVGEGPFDKFLHQRDDADDADFLASRAFDRNTDIRPFLRQPGVLPFKDAISRDVWLDKELGPILENLRIGERRCMFCNAVYKNIDNLGRWQCGWHPGKVDDLGYYTCCNREAPFVGCKRCDHSPSYEAYRPRWNTNNTLIDIPSSTMGILQPEADSLIAEGINSVNPARSLFRIKRAQI